MSKICYTYYIYIVLACLPIGAAARQQVWQHVTAFYSNQSIYEVTGVAVNDTATLLTFVAKGKPDTSFAIMGCCHLRDEQGRCYPVQGAEGVPLGRDVWFDERGTVDFTLSFAPLATSVKTVDFVESELHRCRAVVLGIAEEGAVDVTRYRKRAVSQLIACRRAFGSDEVVVSGRLKGYDPKIHPLSLFLCDESVLADDAQRPLASCHIRGDGSFTLKALVDRPSVMVLASEQGESAWQIPVFVHPADHVRLTVDLGEGRISGYHSKCPTPHLQRLQDLSVLGSDFCQPRIKPTAFSLTATYESSADKGRSIIEAMTRKYRGRYVEFVGLSARTMVPTLNLLSNIRYDFYKNPDIQLVYLFDGRTVPQDYYEKFVARYLGDEDTNLLTADEFAAVREFLLSRESSVVGTLNREGFPLVNPLNYNDEYEFRRRFRMLLHAESDVLSKEELVMMDTMTEVPDSFSLVYDREHTHGADAALIPQPQAQAEHRMLRVLWWLVVVMVLAVGATVYVYRRKRKAQTAEKEEDELTPMAEDKDGQRKSGTDSFHGNLVAAWVAKKPKNAAFLTRLTAACPLLTTREQAMCLIYYSENLPDDKVMEILEISSASAYRTAKSRLRKKLKDVELPEIKKLSL